MTTKKINATEFELAFEEILKEYEDILTEATDEGLDEAAEVYIGNAQRLSPRRTGRYAANWAVYQKKYHLKRYVGNSTTSKEGIPLINLLEYSTGKKRRPHVQKIFNESIPGMLEAIEKNLNKNKESKL